jgi:hypothetical protein
MEINPKTAWWLKHKNDPNIIECMREARRRYYYKNQERLQERGREYYHRRKALTVPPLPCPSGQEEPPAT